jgi:carbonic anhydrase
MIFDQGLGDIFSIRLAGNVASQNAIGSMEYAVKILGSKLIVVLGHTNCGAIKGACDGIQLDNLNALLDHIKPAIAKETETAHDRSGKNKKFVDNVTWLNVQHNIDTILHTSPIICDLLLGGEIGLVGAMYDVETGRAEFIQNDNAKKITHERYAYQYKV